MPGWLRRPSGRAGCPGAGHPRAAPVHRGGLVHHSDRGSRYVSIRYSERLAEAGIEPSVGSVGDSYDNALAETINGLYKAEVIHRRGPWRSFEAVEYATLEWVDWFNNRRLLEPSETSRQPNPKNDTTPCWTTNSWPRTLNQMASSKPGAVQLDQTPVPLSHASNPSGSILSSTVTGLAGEHSFGAAARQSSPLSVNILNCLRKMGSAATSRVRKLSSSSLRGNFLLRQVLVLVHLA